MLSVRRTEIASRDAAAARRPRGVRPLQRFAMTFVMVAFATLLTSCSVSQNALSNPGEAKPDPRLAGVWRPRKARALLYPQVVRVAGGKLPASVVQIDDQPDKKAERKEGAYLGFPTTIGGNTYLNLGSISKDEELKALKDKGWDPDMVAGYQLMRYTIDGKMLRLQAMDLASLKKAIKAGRLKGEIGEETNEPNVNSVANALADVLREPIRVIITDTSENLRRLIASSEITFSEDKDGVFVFERVE